MVRPGFQKDGIVVSQIGIKMYVTIPALGVQVMFRGLIFSVELPFSKFANNTEGQCGERSAPAPLWPSRLWALSLAGSVWCAKGRPQVCPSRNCILGWG